MHLHLEERILVTGGSGFLGSHLCERLLSQGAQVICLDNFFTGARRNIEHLLEHKSFELIRHDVTFPIYLEIDQIYNLACPASPIHYQHDPVQTTKTSVHGAINMLGLAKRVKAKILQASTSEVYGDPDVHPQTEDYWGRVNPIGIRSCYDEGSVSAQIRQERNSYYDILEATQKGDLDITPWLEWFLGCLDRAFGGAETILAVVLTKARFWELHAGASLNDRQRTIINRLLDGFEGKLTSSKWAMLTKCSQDTALRDIDDLVQRGILTKDAAGGRSTSYSLAEIA
jgi:hypothetical protein